MGPVWTPNPRPNAARLLFVGTGVDDYLCLQRFLDNWNLDAARSCAQAVSVFMHQRPTVVVCEEAMPDGTWRSLLGAVQSFRCPPPVIVLSRRADDRLWAEVLRNGGFDVLGCPLDPSRASSSIDYAAGRSITQKAPANVLRMAAQGY